MAFNLSYKESVAKDLKRLPKSEILRILQAIEEHITPDPFAGKALKGDFRGCHRYRLGDYRIIYSINNQTILILKIGHRKDIYR